MRVGLFPAHPLVFEDRGKASGLFIDILENTAKQQNWKIIYVRGQWNDLLESLNKGEIDLLPAVSFTKERDEIYDFNDKAVFIDSGVIFTKPNERIHTIYDLKNKKVAAVKGSIFTTGFEQYVKSFGVPCTILTVDDNPAVMRMISTGEADAGVSIYSLGNELLRRYPVTLTAISFSPYALHYAVPEDKNQYILKAINSALMPPMMSDSHSVYSRSFKTWINPDKFLIPVWVWGGLAFLLGLGTFLTLTSLYLKKQVSLKTSHLEKEIQQRKITEQELKQTVEEKETLIQELFHRTKNTLQIINSIIRLQAMDQSDNQTLQNFVKNTQNRIQTIALVQEMLYRSKDLSHISIRAYLTQLTALILKAYHNNITSVGLELDIIDQVFLIDYVMPVGLIVNELMTNTLKYAFPGKTEGRIHISLTNDGPESYTLIYSDNGTGLPESGPKNKKTLGMRLIRSIGESQLNGSVTYTSQNGLTYTIRIRTDQYEKRV